MSYAGDYSFEELHKGLEYEREYCIDSRVYSTFLETFGDVSPIHVDDAYAQAKGFKGRVMHGAILNGFLSHFIGLHFPGRRGMLLTCDIRYLRPCYLGDTIRLRAVVKHLLETKRVVAIDIDCRNVSEDYLAATARVQVAMLG